MLSREEEEERRDVTGRRQPDRRSANRKSDLEVGNLRRANEGKARPARDGLPFAKQNEANLQKRLPSLLSLAKAGVINLWSLQRAGVIMVFPKAWRDYDDGLFIP